MPPVLFFSLSFPFTRLGYLLFPTAIANGIISGAFAFCEFRVSVHYESSTLTLHFLVDVLYDCMHYAYVFCSFFLSEALIPSPRQLASYATTGVHARDEEVPPRAPLQKLRARVWCYQCVPFHLSAFYSKH